MPSSVIRTFDYDAPQETLTITFMTGRRYAYFDVPAAVAEAFHAAFSKGQFFNAAIRDVYRAERRR